MRTKKQYLRELQDSFKRKQQERNRWQLIAEAMIEAKEPNIQFWIKKLTVFFEKRFYNLPNSNWIEILCGMNDGQAYGRYKDPKAREYCLLVRDLAIRKITGVNQNENRNKAGARALCDVY